MEENKDSKTEIKETEKELETGGDIEENRIEKTEAAETETPDKSEEGEEKEKKAAGGMVSSLNGLYLRTIIGGLILYYAYNIFSGIGTASGTNRTMLYAFVAVFGIAGIWIVLDSIKRILKKEYDE